MTQPSPRGRTSAASVNDLRLLWTSRLLGRWGIVLGATGVGCFVAWYLDGGENNWHDQVAPLNLALVCLVVASAANVGLVIAGRRAVGARRRALLGEPAVGSSGPTRVRALGDSRPSSPLLVGDAGLKHYHRADCSLAADRGWPALSRSEHEAAGRTPCGVCRP
jgi:hypothetical protein